MRATTMTILMLLTLLVAARSASADDTAALEAAQSWYAAMLETGTRLQQDPATTPDANFTMSAPPAILAVFERWNTCKRFAPGSAKPKRPHTLAQLASCLAVLDRNGRVPNATAPSWSVVTLDEAVRTLAMPLRQGLRGRVAARIRRDGKASTIVQATAGGAMFVQAFLAVRASGTIKALWVFEGVAEMEPDSPSQTPQR